MGEWLTKLVDGLGPYVGVGVYIRAVTSYVTHFP